MYTQKYRIWLWPVQKQGNACQLRYITLPLWQAQPFLGLLVTSECLGRPRDPTVDIPRFPILDCGGQSSMFLHT